ncbi:alpha/beta hydrolase [Pontibacterium granulatum]|uniref:alpha/beta hydrolase n=1 Tax=Pontibacterium granulatum TaxID=2036029 RepID=UPI00249A4B25|nr:alpha/beta hydrolase [Pontibacterium granulatum]MDI3326435.1 alpha/beta hydrolase [Pontibacterium granulatum]
MIEQKVKFYSDGLQLDGAFFTDESNNNPDLPIVIACSGFTGQKNIHPERYARAWTPKGYTVFGFDYRGFGESEGIRERVILEEQVRDIANAVAIVRERADAENRKVVLAGWGMAGGLILDAVRLCEGMVDGLVAMNGFFDAVRVQKALRGEHGWKEFKQFMADERLRLAKGGEKEGIDPFKIYPLDPVSREYVYTELVKAPGYGVTSDFDFADSLISFKPEAHLDERFSVIPLLIAHGAENDLHPVTEPKSLYAAYPGPKSLFLLANGGHTEWMLDDDPRFIEFSGHIANWVAENV